jgi:septal ring-binding cell division protein DamX
MLLLLVGLSGCEATEAAERVALVIGNGNYAERPLRRPVQDAGDMAALLKKLGFTVTVATELTLEQMESRVQEFVASARTAEVRLFYYSGHGANYQDHSYLLPVGHGINRAYDMKRKAYPLDALLDGLKEDAPGGVNVVLLDACRDEPFGSQSKSVGGGKGLIPVATAGAGTLVAYAAGSGEQAMELAGDRNSLFTKYLLQRLKEPEEIRLVLTQVRAGVKAENPAQVTETSDKLDQRLYLAGEPGKDSERPPVAAPSVDHDLIAWQSADKCGTAACFRAYVEDYPNGRYARMARARLEPESRPAVVAAPATLIVPPVAPAPEANLALVASSLQEAAWLKERDPGRYTVQVYSGKDLDNLKELATAIGATYPLAYFTSTSRSGPWYSLVVGDYTDSAAAQTAATKLTTRLPVLKPWVRRFDEVQAKLR